MYTLDNRRLKTLKNALGNTVAALFTAIFGAVYELFGHEVYSYYMIYAFVIPLMLGTLPYLIFGLSSVRQPDRFTINAYNSSLAAFTVGCLFEGVLDIYGTTNRLVFVYPTSGAVLFLTAVFSYLISLKKPQTDIG